MLKNVATWLGMGTALTAVLLFLGPLTQPAAESSPDTFGDLAEGPYERLVIRGAMVIPGWGGPPIGPYDIVIEGNTITDMIPFNPIIVGWRSGEIDRPTGERVIDANGMYVMPGMIDLHSHVRNEPMEMEYVHFLRLAHGMTTSAFIPDRGLEHGLEQERLSANNEILAPRLITTWSWGTGLDYERTFVEDPANAQRVAREMADKGARVFDLYHIPWNEELFGAICRAVKETGGVTSVHIQPSHTAVLNAVDAARLGVTMIEHHYAYAESALNRTVQDFPPNYRYDDETDRWRAAGAVWQEAAATNKEKLLTEVVDELVKYGVTMLPTRAVYEANRDYLRAMSLPWHEKYTHQALIEWFGPSTKYRHAYHFDWTSNDEQAWYEAFDLWGDLIYEFNKRGGRVVYGTDDPFMFGTPGFSNVRELQLLRETGMHALEVIKAATFNGAETLGLKRLGLVHPGYLADLLIVDGNPAYNLRFLYAFGALRLDENKSMIRTKGIVHTIKDGIVIDNARLMEEVAEMVAKSKEGVDLSTNIIYEPFMVKQR